MLGAIVGDVVGSRFEFNNHRSKDFELFVNSCEATDDSIMTIAIGKALVETDKEFEVIDEEYLELLKENSVKYMQEIGRKYPHCGFGGRFYGWIFSNEFPKPYNSYGNGSAMRVSPVVYFSKTIDDVKKLSKAVTEVSHNHPEGIK
ncbi:MAG: ADP-ribosylglycohydrolase, partial [Tissierellia bacterium]|nr:ADP-ribosylglycohydrolase [Tissierellia bacterium]